MHPNINCSSTHTGVDMTCIKKACTWALETISRSVCQIGAGKRVDIREKRYAVLLVV